MLHCDKIALIRDLMPPGKPVTRADWQHAQRSMRIAGVASQKLKPRPYPLLRAEHQVHKNAATRSEAANVMLHYFADNEAGVQVTAADLMHVHQNTNAKSCQPAARNIPTILDTVRFAATTSPYKAVGPDGIHPKLETIAPHETARHLHPLLVKIAVTAQEPIIAKGGPYAILGKANRTAEQARLPEAYRAILLNSRIAKHHHAFLRG